MPIEHLIDVDRETGELIQGWPRIKQSIMTILTTRLRTRIMRLWWGSNFLGMQDKPGTQEVLAESIFEAAQAVNAYEPEFKIREIIINELAADGHILVTVEGVDLIDQQTRISQVSI